MPSKSLPAMLHQVLEEHVAHSDLSHDDELQGIFERLDKLNENVERVKSIIMSKKAGSGNS